MLNERNWLERQIKGINEEMNVANRVGTNNAKQSIVIYTMWKAQLVIRLKELS